MIQLSLFSKYPQIYHGFSQRADGNMSSKKGVEKSIRNNRLKIAKKLGFETSKSIYLKQVHGTNVKIVDRIDAKNLNNTGKPLNNTDSAVTGEINTTLLVLTADCLPILFFEPDRQIIAIAHAGWRGIMGKIFLKTMLAMHSAKGCEIKRIRVGIGPSIGKCCQILRDPTFLDNYPEWSEFKSVDAQNRVHMDLVGFTLNELVNCGVKATNIEVINHCTCHMQDLYFSHKRGETERQVSYIGLKDI